MDGKIGERSILVGQIFQAGFNGMQCFQYYSERFLKKRIINNLKISKNWGEIEGGDIMPIQKIFFPQ